MFELFSRRQKKRSGEPEVFIYDVFPETFRNQFFKIIRRTFQELEEYNERFRWWRMAENICESFAEEKGMKVIEAECDGVPYTNDVTALEGYIDQCSSQDFLNLMDFTFGYWIYPEIKSMKDDFLGDIYVEYINVAVESLNLRLRQHDLGYEFISGEIIIKTNTVAHETIVKPALKLLVDEDFRGAEEEYLRAYECWKQGENEDAITNAAKAFESTMKTICTKLDYKFDQHKDAASKLIQKLQDNNFYPPYLNNHFNGIRTTLESGAPTVRNKDAGHGQGSEVRNVEDEYVEYVLNLVATNIIFLYKLYRKKLGR